MQTAFKYIVHVLLKISYKQKHTDGRLEKCFKRKEKLWNIRGERLITIQKQQNTFSEAMTS